MCFRPLSGAGATVHQLLARAAVSGFFPDFNYFRSLPPSAALSLYSSLRRLGFFPHSSYILSALVTVASGHQSRAYLVHQLHLESIKLGYVADTYVTNALLHLYSFSRFPYSAALLFNTSSPDTLDAVSYNSMISCYLSNDQPADALRFFARMVCKDCFLRIDSATPVVVLAACARTGQLKIGRTVHGMALTNGYALDFHLGSSLISMYAKCGAVEDARKAFDRMPDTNVVCWTSIISGYAQAGRFRESIELFREMQAAGVRPDDATVASVVCSCAQLGALDQGRYVHAYCDSYGIGNTLIVRNALIDMYSKCGDIERARRIFRGLARRDVFSWTAMIVGLAMNSQPEEALDLFLEMEESGEVLPNDITFLGVLSACCHGGLVEKGYYNFNRMMHVYKLVPRLEHFGCMVDLLGRAKRLAEAEQFIREMPMEPDVVIWRSLLFACRANGNVELAEFAAQRIMETEPRRCGGPVLLSNVYASTSRWSDVNRVRRTMGDQSIQKQPGCSFIEINGTVNEFLAANLSHHHMEIILDLLSGISRILLSEPCIFSTMHLAD